MSEKNLTIKEVMQRNTVTIYLDQNVFDASVLMAHEHIGAIPVIDKNGYLVGILTDRDIVTRCNAVSKNPHKMRVSECMTVNPIRTVPSATLNSAAKLMGEYGVRRLPIVEGEKLIGLLSISDIAQICNHCPNEKFPYDSCILIDMAKELQRSSQCKSC